MVDHKALDHWTYTQTHSRTLLQVGGGAVASWLVCSTLRVRVLAGDIALYSWARHFTLTVPLSTQGGVVEKPVNANPGLKGNQSINFSCIIFFRFLILFFV